MEAGRNVSTSCLALQAPFSTREAIPTIMALAFLAPAGHTPMHRMQEMHAPGSATKSAPMAPAGQAARHAPQPMHALVRFGTRRRDIGLV